MTENIINWFMDLFAHREILDLDFIQTDLVDMPINDEERSETAFYDASAAQIDAEYHKDSSVPIGKRVL